MREAAVGLWLGVLIITISSSGCEGGSIGCESCEGCCKGSVCYPGNTSAACGVNGAVCAVCTSGTCTDGECGQGGGCGPASCPQGCCLNQFCMTSQSAAMCGTGGVPCQSCGGGPCLNGQCNAAACNSSNCAQGCCLGAKCVSYAEQNPSACGSGGAACQSCGGAACTSGLCQSGCSAATCSQGCCYQGACLPLAQQTGSACGTGGSVCQPCPSGTCQNGLCGGGTCNSTNCMGCCTAGGQCLFYNQQSNSSCGKGGVTCSLCPPGHQCQNGNCNPVSTCDSSNCAAGCCHYSLGTVTCTLLASQDNSKCGTSAAPCQACGFGKACQNGTCLAGSKVIVVSAVVTDKPGGWDGSWSTSGPEPDPYVVVRVTATARTGETKYVNDSFTPSFNQEVFTETEQALTAGLSAEVHDDDGILPAEKMGSCTASSIPLATVQGGQIDLQSCSGNVTRVSLKFSK